MRILSFLLAFCFSFNVLAGASAASKLERQMDDYQYALTVEWDQKDNIFFENQTNAFFENIGQLIQKEGLSKEDVLSVVESKMKNPDALRVLKAKLALLPENMSQEDLVEVLKSVSKDLYSEGASWNGHTVFNAAFLIVFFGTIAYSVWWEAHHECVAYENQYMCTSTGFHGFISCGYRDVCTQYVEK